jgi:hypothetical protein
MKQTIQLYANYLIKINYENTKQLHIREIDS